mgnify:CR=1 FL=1
MSGRESSARVTRLGRLRRSAILAAALTLPALVIATQLYVGYGLRGVRVPFGGVFVLQLCHWELWVIAGPLVWNLARRWPLGPALRPWALLRHALAAIAVAVALLSFYLVLLYGDRKSVV